MNFILSIYEKYGLWYVSVILNFLSGTKPNLLMNNLGRKFLASGLFFLMLYFPFRLTAQGNSIIYGAGTSAYAGTHAALPFWMYANTNGVVAPESANLVSQIYSYYTSVDTSNSFRLQTGFDAYGRFAADKSLFFSELYGSIGYHFLNLNIGRFYDRVGITNDNLSMGSMMVSRNATPVPKIQLATNGFTDIPFTQSYLQFKAMLSHGWLESDRYVKSPYLHQKFFYLKVNYKNVEAIGGAIHNVIWGGTHPQQGALPSSFNSYLRVLTGLGASENSDVPSGEITNVIGNSVAAYDTGLNINFNNFQFKAYRLFYLEDKVSTRFRSPWDGLWGAGIELKEGESFVNEILWEHLSTRRQDSFHDQPRGRASYYAHEIYRSGWTYKGNVFGNPLLLAGPNPNFGMKGNISNNIIVAHHLGIKGKPTPRLFYKAFFTYSRNYGTVLDQTQQKPPIPIGELRVDEYSGMLSLNYLIVPEYGLSVSTSLALDMGELYENNRLGFQLGIRWDRIAR